MEEIIAYLNETYHPLSIILYGSFADGTNNAQSDFDALVITERHPAFHDVSEIDGTLLDVLIYPLSEVTGEFQDDRFIFAEEGKVIADTRGVGADFKERLLAYIAALPHKTEEELEEEIAWCRRMFSRTERQDAEGMFRWHWLLMNSLEVFCDILHHPYWGPKKSLKWMRTCHPASYERYTRALYQMDEAALRQWISCLFRKYDELHPKKET